MARIKINRLSVINACDIAYITPINTCASKADIPSHIKRAAIEFLRETSPTSAISGKGVQIISPRALSAAKKAIRVVRG